MREEPLRGCGTLAPRLIRFVAPAPLSGPPVPSDPELAAVLTGLMAAGKNLKGILPRDLWLDCE